MRAVRRPAGLRNHRGARERGGVAARGTRPARGAGASRGRVVVWRGERPVICGTRDFAVDLVRLAPDVIVVGFGTALRAVQEETKTIPIVVLRAGDLIEGGFVKDAARPEGNTTRSAASGRSCSRRLPRTSTASYSCPSIRTLRIGVQSKRPRNRWGNRGKSLGATCRPRGARHHPSSAFAPRR